MQRTKVRRQWLAPVVGLLTLLIVGAAANGAIAAGVEWIGLKGVQYAIDPAGTSVNLSELGTTMATGGAFGAAFRLAGKALGIGGCFVAGTTVSLASVPEERRVRVPRKMANEGVGLERYCFRRPNAPAVASPPQPTPTKVPIESVPLGARVNTKNPKPWEYDTSLPDPIAADWMRVTFVVERSDGGVVDLELLRPAEWVESLRLEPGRALPFQLPELQISGVARVVSIEPCPRLADGEGQVITGRFVTREVAATVRATLEGGSVIEGTAIHPIWSVDRQDWIPLGELVEGEQLRGTDGPVRVTSLEVVPHTTSVYNLEVHGEHVYQVGDLGVLVHNAYLDTNLIGRIAETLGVDRLLQRGWKPIATLAHGRNGLDIIAQKTISGRLRTMVVEVKANGSATSALQRLGAAGYAKNVLDRLGSLRNLSPGAQQAKGVLEDMIKNKEPIRGVVMRFDWRSGTLMETIKSWIAGVR